MSNIVPYTFDTTYPQQVSQQPATPNMVNGVYIMVPPDYDFILEKMGQWFANRPEVQIICDGKSDKHGLGYIMIEWQGYLVDQLFLDILDNEDAVADYATYVRELE